MNIKLAENCYIRKTRKNTTQKCNYCGCHLPKGTVAISFHKPIGGSCNGVNIWIHTKCAPKYFKTILKNIDPDVITAYSV